MSKTRSITSTAVIIITIITIVTITITINNDKNNNNNNSNNNINKKARIQDFVTGGRNKGNNIFVVIIIILDALRLRVALTISQIENIFLNR